MKPTTLHCMSDISAELRLQTDEIPSPDASFLGSRMCDNKDQIPPGTATNTLPFETLVSQTTHFTSDKFPLVPPDAKMSSKEVLTKSDAPHGCRKEHLMAMERQLKGPGGTFKTGCKHMVEGCFCDNTENRFGLIIDGPQLSTDQPGTNIVQLAVCV